MLLHYGLLAFFGVYGISLSMMNVSELAAVQTFMTLYRGVGVCMCAARVGVYAWACMRVCSSYCGCKASKCECALRPELPWS